MPPKLPARLAHSLHQPRLRLFSFLVPCLQLPQTRNASILSSLSDNPSAYNKKIRRGRGPSSGKGKTSGRGQKGQKARGKVPKGFSGGQTPESVTHGKMGFKNVHHVEMSELNLDTVQSWIDQGRLNPDKPITLKEIHKSNAVHGVKDGVKLLARGSTALKTPVHMIVSRASQTAIEAVEKAGGSVTTRFYTPIAIRRIRQGLMHPYLSLKWDPTAIGIPALLPVSGMTPEERVTGLGFQYRLPDPSSRKDLEYYRDAKNRGYLAHTVAEGESASLYWKPPISEDELRTLKKNSTGTGEVRRREENKLW